MERKRRFFLVRVGVLLFVLFVVVLYAIRDLRSRRARNDWERTVDVAVILVHVAGTERPDDEALQKLAERAPVLEERLRAEAVRHGRSMVPFRIRILGPVETSAPPPSPASDGTWDLALQAIAMKRWLAAIDPAANVDPALWDTRIYVSVRKPASDLRSFVEGESEQGGRIGTIAVELDGSMSDLTLFVVTHELMHTLGATDRYDANGRTLVPDGLPEPDRGYPQRLAEVMARNRVVAPEKEVPPASIAELAVGMRTAREIGWIP